MKVIFLDRDGVINEFPGNGFYVTKVKDFHFIPGSLEAIQALTQSGHEYLCHLPIRRQGLGQEVSIPWISSKRIDAKMTTGVEKAGGKIRKSFYCTHRSDAGCDCRKPGIGLLKKALKSLNKTIVHAQKAFFVGDTEGDIKTGHNASCRNYTFVLSGHQDRRYMRKWTVKPDFIVKNLKAAVPIIQNENSSLTHATAGARHKKAAERAIFHALQAKRGVEVRLVDALDYANPIFKKTYPWFYGFLVTRLLTLGLGIFL